MIRQENAQAAEAHEYSQSHRRKLIINQSTSNTLVDHLHRHHVEFNLLPRQAGPSPSHRIDNAHRAC